MSQHGGDTASLAAAGPSKPPLQLRERTASAWKDFQSLVSENAIADDDDDGGKSPTQKADREEKEQMFKKWQGFASGLQNTVTLPQRVPSVKHHHKPSAVQTIHEEHHPQATHKPVSLLGDPNVDSVISKVQVFKGGISDVLPVTDFQSLAITGSLLESRWMLNHFYLEASTRLYLVGTAMYAPFCCLMCLAVLEH